MPLQQETLQKLRVSITAFQKLSQEDKQEWLGYIELLPPEYVLFVLELLEKYPEDYLRLHDNLKVKKGIIASRDRNAWKELLTQEAKFLEEQTQEQI